MSETEGFSVRTTLIAAEVRAGLIAAAIEAVRDEAAAVRCGLPVGDAGPAETVAALEAAGGRDESDPDRPRTGLIAAPTDRVIAALTTVAPLTSHATIWDGDANLLLDITDADGFWIRTTPESIESLVADVADVRVVPDGDWVPGTNSRAKRAWGRRTRSRFGR